MFTTSLENYNSNKWLIVKRGPIAWDTIDSLPYHEYVTICKLLEVDLEDERKRAEAERNRTAKETKASNTSNKRQTSRAKKQTKFKK